MFQIPEDPTPLQITKLLSVCSNQLARLAELVATYKSDVAIKTTLYKRAEAKAKVKYQGSGKVDIVRAMVELDGDVITSLDELNVALASYELAKGELEGYDAHFTALRKMAELRKVEMRTGCG